MLRAYFNDRAARWDETVAEKDAAKLACLADRLDIKPGSVVLDVGTGTGVFLPYILRKVGDAGQVIALDFAEAMLREARSKGFPGNVRYLQADVASIPLRDAICDAIVCYSSFPHFPDKPKALKEMARVLRDGGLLVICHSSSRTRINEIHHRIPAVCNDTLPAADVMKDMLDGADFTDVTVEDGGESYFLSARKLPV